MPGRSWSWERRNNTSRAELCETALGRLTGHGDGGGARVHAVIHSPGPELGPGVGVGTAEAKSSAIAALP